MCHTKIIFFQDESGEGDTIKNGEQQNSYSQDQNETDSRASLVSVNKNNTFHNSTSNNNLKYETNHHHHYYNIFNNESIASYIVKLIASLIAYCFLRLISIFFDQVAILLQK